MWSLPPSSRMMPGAGGDEGGRSSGEEGEKKGGHSTGIPREVSRDTHQGMMRERRQDNKGSWEKAGRTHNARVGDCGVEFERPRQDFLEGRDEAWEVKRDGRGGREGGPAPAIPTASLGVLPFSSSMSLPSCGPCHRCACSRKFPGHRLRGGGIEIG